jgi:transposase
MTIVTLGLDLGKNWIHMVGLDADGRIVLQRRVGRDRLLAQTGNMASCLIGMEACCGVNPGPKWVKIWSGPLGPDGWSGMN